MRKKYFLENGIPKVRESLHIYRTLWGRGLPSSLGPLTTTFWHEKTKLLSYKSHCILESCYSHLILTSTNIKERILQGQECILLIFVIPNDIGSIKDRQLNEDKSEKWEKTGKLHAVSKIAKLLVCENESCFQRTISTGPFIALLLVAEECVVEEFPRFLLEVPCCLPGPDSIWILAFKSTEVVIIPNNLIIMKKGIHSL